MAGYGSACAGHFTQEGRFPPDPDSACEAGFNSAPPLIADQSILAGMSLLGLALPSHALAAPLLASDGIQMKEAFPIVLQQRIERQRIQRAVRRYDQGLDPSEAILQGRDQLVIGNPPQCWQ